LEIFRSEIGARQSQSPGFPLHHFALNLGAAAREMYGNGNPGCGESAMDPKYHLNTGSCAAGRARQGLSWVRSTFRLITAVCVDIIAPALCQQPPPPFLCFFSAFLAISDDRHDLHNNLCALPLPYTVGSQRPNSTASNNRSDDILFISSSE